MSRRIVLSDEDPLMTPAEVAAALRVSPHTVAVWANAGKLPATRTVGGHRRYRRSAVEALLNDGRTEQPDG